MWIYLSFQNSPIFDTAMFILKIHRLSPIFIFVTDNDKYEMIKTVDNGCSGTQNPSQYHLANRPGINTVLRWEKTAVNCPSHSTAILSTVCENWNNVLPSPKKHWILDTTLENPHFSWPGTSWRFPVQSTESALKGWRFCDATDIIKNATEELKRLSQNGFPDCFQHPSSRRQKSIAAELDCFEGNVA